MMHIIPQTPAQKRAMYMRCTKADLVTMLMNNQDLAEAYCRLLNKENPRVSGEASRGSVDGLGQ